MINVRLYRYNQPSKAIFLDLLELISGTRFTYDDIILGTPIPKGRVNTLIPIGATPWGVLEGDTQILYKRIDLNYFFFNTPLYFYNLNDLSNESISKAFLDKYSVLLEPEDFILDYKIGHSRYPIEIHLKVKENSLIWVGELTFWSMPDNYIGQLFQSEKDIMHHQLRRNAFLYSIEKDINGLSDRVIEQLPVNTTITTLDTETIHLLNALNELTGDPWVIEGSKTPYNLKEAWVIYHGAYDPTHPGHQVISLFLNSRLCTNLFGSLLLHYSLPSLETAIEVTHLDGFTL